MKVESFLAGVVISGIIAILGDILVRQTVIEQVYEIDHISTECRQYRRTYPHFVSVAALGMTVFIVMSMLQYRFKTLRHFLNGAENI